MRMLVLYVSLRTILGFMTKTSFSIKCMQNREYQEYTQYMCLCVSYAEGKREGGERECFSCLFSNVNVFVYLILGYSPCNTRVYNNK